MLMRAGDAAANEPAGSGESLVDHGELRRREFSRLDATRTVYLDYAGAALYPESLIRRDASRLRRRVMGNPHSESAPSMASTDALDDARARTLRFFDASPEEYDVVFTANASSAIRILAEAYPFRDGCRLVLTADNHNSVNGLRIPARRRRAAVQHVPLDAKLRARDPRPWLPRTVRPSLFGFPAQSNFSGVRHPLDWVRDAQALGYHVLLDAAAHVPSAPLSLRRVPADFVAISYYKMFGYPTGVGALLARRDALAMLERDYFAGGTVQFASVQNNLVRLWTGGRAFEDGTPNFLAMPAIGDGLRWLGRIGMPSVHAHVSRIARVLLDRLLQLGDRVRIYGPDDCRERGGIVAFNVCVNGKILDYEAVEAAARQRRIAIRGGCFCNPGAAEQAFGFDAAGVRACLDDAFSISRFRACLGGPAVGALRASPGLATTEADIDRLIDLVTELTAHTVAVGA
jgi:selenocysteine lyase/cysteine desulfurase